MRRKQNSLRSRGSGISISMRSNTVCVAQTDSAEAACVSRLPMTIGTRDLSVEWRNILKVYECLQLADFVAKVGGPLQVRNFRIQRARRLNQCCAAGLFFESMLRVRMRKFFLQQYRHRADIPRLRVRGCFWGKPDIDQPLRTNLELPVRGLIVWRRHTLLALFARSTMRTTSAMMRFSSKSFGV